MAPHQPDGWYSVAGDDWYDFAMDARNTAKAMAIGRMALGAGLLARPAQTAHGWLGDDISRPVTRMLVQSIGARDLLLGAGTLLALQSGQPARRWVQVAIAADAADTVLTLLAFRSLPAVGRIATLAMTVGAAAGGLRIAGGVDGSLDINSKP